jgi:integrase
MTPPRFLALVDEYLAVRRGLGFDADTPRWLLRSFIEYANRVGHHGSITTDLAVQWALTSRSRDPAQATRRLSAVRPFARYCAVFDPATEIPPAGFLGRLPRRKPPHIYSEAEILALLRQAHGLRPRRGLRPQTYVALFALLASTGLRLSEACRLTGDDVDLAGGVLTIRESKFRKSRLVPLHPTATQALIRYADAREACRAVPRSGRFFCTDRAPALTRAAVEKTFSRLRQRLDWSGQGRARRPRIHDMRHTFAVRRLLHWVENGANVDHQILALSTYLGHAKVTDTYWYLSAIPELIALTAQRFERFARAAQEVAP